MSRLMAGFMTFLEQFFMECRPQGYSKVARKHGGRRFRRKSHKGRRIHQYNECPRLYCARSFPGGLRTGGEYFRNHMGKNAWRRAFAKEEAR